MTEHFDYWIDSLSLEQWSGDESKILLAQVLVRGVDSLSNHLPHGYASSTHSVQVGCSDSITKVLDTTDFDRDGRSIGTRSTEQIGRQAKTIEPAAATALVRLLCW